VQDTEPGLDMAAQFWTGQAVFFRPVTRKVHSLPNKLKVLPARVRRVRPAYCVGSGLSSGIVPELRMTVSEIDSAVDGKND
jgi:hypothetical protein